MSSLSVYRLFCFPRGNQDLLVGRYPMHRRSDVQKVRAVYSDQLAYIQDVIVFPMRGRYPLAEKMSNGDYDGDRYWVCWGPSLVQGFKNAPPPTIKPPGELGIEVDSETLSESLRVGGVHYFLNKNFEFHIQNNVLGRCANHQESYSYLTNTICSTEVNRLGDLRNYLVDAPTNGYRFSNDA